MKKLFVLCISLATTMLALTQSNYSAHNIWITGELQWKEGARLDNDKVAAIEALIVDSSDVSAVTLDAVPDTLLTKSGSSMKYVPTSAMGAITSTGAITAGTGINIGVTPANETTPSLIILGDADSDAGGDTDEALTIDLTANATPTSAVWDITSTQSAGYRVDKSLAVGLATPNETTPVLSIRGDADSDAADVTEVMSVTLTPNATETSAVWDITSTQSAGYRFDKSVKVGPASANDVQPTFLVQGDADSDAGGDTQEALTVTLTPNATPTLATWGITSTQSAGYTFDKPITNNGYRNTNVIVNTDESETVTAAMSGAMITFDGAGTLTIPDPSSATIGVIYYALQTANNNLIVTCTTADNNALVCDGVATSDAVTISTSSHLIGAGMIVIGISATQWFVGGLNPESLLTPEAAD